MTKFERWVLDLPWSLSAKMVLVSLTWEGLRELQCEENMPMAQKIAYAIECNLEEAEGFLRHAAHSGLYNTNTQTLTLRRPPLSQAERAAEYRRRRHESHANRHIRHGNVTFRHEERHESHENVTKRHEPDDQKSFSALSRLSNDGSNLILKKNTLKSSIGSIGSIGGIDAGARESTQAQILSILEASPALLASGVDPSVLAATWSTMVDTHPGGRQMGLESLRDALDVLDTMCASGRATVPSERRVGYVLKVYKNKTREDTPAQPVSDEQEERQRRMELRLREMRGEK